MRSFHPDQLNAGQVALALVWLTNDIAEARGRLDLSHERHPVVLETLRQVAFAQSIESSNRIEGVTVSQTALDALVRDKRRPRDRSEEEIAGYRNALAWIHEHHQDIELSPDTLRELHRLALGEIGHAGHFKTIRSDIYLFEASRPPRLLFATVAPEEVPAAIDELCGLYHHVVSQRLTLPLLAAARFILDFLAIHPFVDGNGRVSRLVWLLLLYHQGHVVGRYISLERIVEQHKEGYYEALQRSQVGWHEGHHDPVPWSAYFLTTVKRAYRELETHFDALTETTATKTELVERIIDRLPPIFTRADIARHVHDVSDETVRNVLRSLKARGRIVQQGRGRATRWKKMDGGEQD